MAETLNKRIMPALAAEARENARRYWAQKEAAARSVTPAPGVARETRQGNPAPDDPSLTDIQEMK